MEKKSTSIDDLFDQADRELNSDLTGLRITDGPAHQHVREDVKQLSCEALEQLLIGLCEADHVNTARVHKVLQTAKEEGDKAREEEAELLADGHQSNWQTINKGKVVIEHLRKEKALDDVYTFVGASHGTGATTIEGPPLAPGEAVCKHCRRRYFRKYNIDLKACAHHEGEPEHHAVSGPGETPSPQFWTWPCCGQKELDLVSWKKPCMVGKHKPRIYRPWPPGVVYDDSDSDLESESESEPEPQPEPQPEPESQPEPKPTGDEPAGDDTDAQLNNDSDLSMHSVQEELYQMSLDSESP